MRFMVLVRGADTWADDPDYDVEADMARHDAFTVWCKEEGIAILDGAALQPSAMATTIDNRDGRQRVIDGAAVETREFVRGYYVFEVDSWDRATEVATRVPDGNPAELRLVPHSLGEDPRQQPGALR